MKTRMTLKIAGAFILLSFFLVSCAASGTPTNSTAKAKPKVYNPAGSWEYTVETPDGGSSGTMTINGNPGAYTASLQTDQFGTLEINGLNVQDTNMTGNIEVMGTVAQIECQFDGDNMTGAVYLGQDVFPMSGKRASK